MCKNNCTTCSLAVKAAKYHISDSNRKLVPSKDSNFLIWNLPAVITCPFRTAHCEESCYARKSERCYPEVLPARMENLKMSKSDSFVKDMTDIILTRAKKMKKSQLIVRIHESGDFYNKEYAEKWLQIIRNCQHDKKILFIAYTKSFKYFDGIELPENFSLRASIWDDTKESQKKIVKRNNWDIYTAVEKFTDSDDFCQCRCKDCATCGKCWDNTVKDIRCEIH